MSDKPKLSPVEVFKEQSNFLRGDIGAELHDGNDFFGKGSVQLLKHHGTYQQDDRDARAGGRKDATTGKAIKDYSFMVRTKIPGGKLTSSQLLAELDLGDEVGSGTLRITSRQGLQLHGVLKQNLWQSIHRINEIQLSTLAACGDVEAARETTSSRRGSRRLPSACTTTRSTTTRIFRAAATSCAAVTGATCCSPS